MAVADTTSGTTFTDQGTNTNTNDTNTSTDTGQSGGATTPYWQNGVTRTLEPGIPPEGWTVDADGWWYPPGVATTSTSGSTGSGTSATGSAATSSSTPLYTPLPTSLQIFVRIEVGGIPAPQDVPLTTNITVYPAVINYASVTQSIDASVQINPIVLKLKERAMSAIDKLLNGKIETFYDRDRVLKTLVNFGSDYQALLTNWQYDTADPTGQTIIVRLYESLPGVIEPKVPVWLVTELAQPLIDRVFVQNTPPPPPKVYLRPANRNLKIVGVTGASVENVTLGTLLSTGSSYDIRQTDPVLERWFTDDVNSAELNINYGDYSTFVFFGSAQARLDAFVQKLTILENYDSILAFNSASRAGTGSAAITGSATYGALQSISEKRIDLIRTFDGYERYLYYGSGSAYSASLGSDTDDAFYYNADATWPKLNGNVAPVASASAWYLGQSTIATAYDEYNINSLVHNIPAYIRNDDNSAEYLTFLNMIGHQLDNMKPYIDQMTLINDRRNDAATGLSPDLIWNVAEAFGIKLPNQYAVKQLVDYTIGQVGNVGTQVYRDAASETWKRFLHNQIFLMKTKGTKTSLRALSNAYGILPTLLQIRESQTPGFDYPSASFEVFEQQTNVLNFSNGLEYLTIPWSASSVPTINTLELRFASTAVTSSTLINASNVWSVNVIPLTGAWGNIVINSGSTPVLSSSYLQLFSGDFYSLMLRNNSVSTDLLVERAEQENIVESFSGTGTGISAIWTTPPAITVGGSGSLTGFIGYLDEFRAWGEVLTTDNFSLHVKYPGMYNGNTSTSARDSLYVRLSFGKPVNLGTGSVGGQFVPNESPYIKTPSASALLTQISASGFPDVPTFPNSMMNLVREVTRHTPNAGANIFSTNKVTVASTPTLMYLSGSSVPVLSSKNSVVALSKKATQPQSTNIVGFYFSITDAINDNIIRTLGNIDLQDLIGDPADLYNSNYTGLGALNNLYWTNYAYTFNPNSFVDFVRNLLTPLFEQARQLVPVRAKLLSGIVHEPHILERHKQTITPRPIKDVENFETVAVVAHPSRSQGSYPSYTTRIAFTGSTHVYGTNPSYKTRLVTTSSVQPSALYQPLKSKIVYTGSTKSSATSEYYTTNVQHVTASLPSVQFRSFDDFTNFAAYKKTLLSSFGVSDPMALGTSQQQIYYSLLAGFKAASDVRIQASILDQSKTYMHAAVPTGSYIIRAIEPYTDFTKYDGTTFFADPRGIVGVPTYTQTRLNQNILNNRGTWITGSTYSRYDFVGISSSIGNVTEYVCITFNNPFVSSIDPSQDPQNWRQMTYISNLVYVAEKATVISGSISLVSTGSALSGFMGYRPTHYRFTRDRRAGRINQTYRGCLQTQNTTTDGKPPVEVIPSAGDKLVVNNPGTPIQPNNNQSGPILDVR